MDVAATVKRTVIAIAAQKGLAVAELRNDQRLAELGFESLDFAQLVAMLETELGADPFASDATIGDIRTIGDICDVYSRFCTKTTV